MQRHKLLSSLCAAAVLAGCNAVGPNFTPPKAPTDTGFAMAGDDANPAGLQAEVGQRVVGDWWTLFHSPALDALMREAIADNLTLAQARARLAQARDAVGAEGGLLTADATAGVKRQRANLNAFSGGAFSPSSLPAGLAFPTNPEFNLYSIGGSVSYNLDLFGGERRRRESLEATAEAQARELDAAYLTLTGKVVVQVLIIADANSQIASLQKIADADRKDLDMIVKAKAAGGASSADVAAAQGQLASDAAAIPDQRQRLVKARHALAVLVGKAPSEWTAPEFDAGSGALPPSLPASLPSALVRERPDILEAEAKLHAATAEIGVATADLYPKITLSASLNQDALTPQTLFSPTSTSWAFGPALTLPLFHSGELHARRREAQDAARVALFAYQETVLEAFAQVDDALQAIAHDNQTYIDQTKALDAAATQLDMARKAFAAGGVTAVQLVGYERSLQRARLLLQQYGAGRYTDAATLLLTVASAPPGAAAGE